MPSILISRTRLALALAPALAAILSGCATVADSHLPAPNRAATMAATSPAPASQLPSRDAAGAAAIDLAEVTRINTDLAAQYFTYRQFDAAQEAINRALAAEPESPRALVLAGFILIELKDQVQAQHSFDRAIRAAPKDPDILHSYGTFLCRTAREANSISYFEKAIATPTYRRPSVSHAALGSCLMRLQRESEALKHFSEALALEPMHPQALLGAADLEHKQGRTERARELLRRHLQVARPTPESLWLEVRIARALGHRGDEAMAASDLREKFADSPQAKQLAAGNGAR